MRRSIAPGKVPHACCGRITVGRRLLAAVMPPFMPPFMTRVLVLTGGSLIERIYSPAADQLSRERQSDLSWRNDKPKGWLAS